VRISQVDRSPTWGTEIKIDADGDGDIDFTGEPGDTYVAMYDQADEYVAEAWLDDSSVGTFLVVVFDVDLNGPTACEVGYRREKDVDITPVGSATEIFFGAGDEAVLEVSLKEFTATGATLNLKPLVRGTPVLTARLGGETGPIVAWKEIDEFTLDVPARWGILSINGSPFTTILTMRPFIPDLEVEFDMFASEATFEGGLTYFTVTPDDPPIAVIPSVLRGDHSLPDSQRIDPGHTVDIRFHVIDRDCDEGEVQPVEETEVSAPSVTQGNSHVQSVIVYPFQKKVEGASEGKIRIMLKTGNQHLDKEVVVEAKYGDPPDPVDDYNPTVTYRFTIGTLTRTWELSTSD